MRMAKITIKRRNESERADGRAALYAVLNIVYDPSKDILCDMTLEDFLDLGINKYSNGEIYYRSFKFISSYGGNDESYLSDNCYGENEGKFQIKKYIKVDKDRWTYGYKVGYDTKILEPKKLNEIYELMKPKYVQRYLENGREYEREYKV